MEEQTLESLKAHGFECIINRDKWQSELDATVRAIANFKEPEVTTKEEVNE